MSATVYETMVILDSNRYARDPGGVSSFVPHLIENAGGEVLVSRLWADQKLAYPIDGHRKGTYWLIYHRTGGGKLHDIERAMQINENVLRSLTIKVDPRLVDALVEHAKTGGAAGAIAAKPEAASPAAAPDTSAAEGAAVAVADGSGEAKD